MERDGCKFRLFLLSFQTTIVINNNDNKQFFPHPEIHKYYFLALYATESLEAGRTPK